MYAIANNNNNSNHPDQSDSSEDEDMEVEEETPGETTLEASSKLLRYLYIGNDINVIISQRYRQVDLRDLDVRLEFINELAALRPNLPFQFIKRIMLSNTLWRKDEAILALAYCLRRLTTVVPEEYIKLKTEIYNSLHLLLKTDSDLFLFVYLSQKILTDVNGRKSFGRGMKRALFRWYEKKSPEELAEMFGRNRGMYGWTHANIIYLCHMKFGTDAKSQLISTLFKRGSESIAEQQSMETLPPAVRRFFDICSLKVNESATDAAEKIELHNFDADNLPVHLISQHQVWNKLLPKMEYRQLLKIFQTLHSLNLLKPKIPLYSTMCESLGSSQSIKKACMHPLEIYSIHNLYKKNARYNETIKHTWYKKKKVNKNNLVIDATLTSRLMTAVDASFDTCPETGCNFFITLDLRTSTSRHTVLRMSQLSCLEAMVLLTLAFHKREKSVESYTFTNSARKLMPLKMNKEHSFKMAMAHCKQLLIRQTRQNLKLPFEFVNKTSKNTIFITIVDSLGRFCNSKVGCTPIRQFRSYRESNPHSKFIVLNLRRSKGDLKFQYEKGFLEICGLTPDTWRIINAFAVNSFV